MSAPGSTLKIDPGFSHGMPTTNANQINADPLAFIQQSKQVAAHTGLFVPG